ncbi:MAG: cysteine desulfurase [Thermotogota bacterium]|nr:cysteine desulfurase [Thermotogota bacterium]HCZ07396.1 cysteine desulfurase [Thermotogota bacterium]
MRIYLDNNATTKIDAEALELMVRCYTENYGNPNSLHRMGVEASNLLEDARRTFARLLRVPVESIFFTSSATESINWALRSAVRTRARLGKTLVIGEVEHSAVLNTAKDIAQTHGLTIKMVPVNKRGEYLMDELEKLLDDEVILVALMSANNETGTLQDLTTASRIVKKKSPSALFLVDAVQSFGKAPMDIEKWDPDFLVLSAHKFHGPKGVGVLYVKEDTPLVPMITGGGQERGMRSGTQNVPGIVGAAKAAENAMKLYAEAVERMRTHQHVIAEGVKRLGGVVITPLDNSLPNTVMISFPGIAGQHLVNALSAEGIYVSTHSACGSKKPSSHVLRAMKLDPLIERGAVRISTSRYTEDEEIKRFLEVLEEVTSLFRL